MNGEVADPVRARDERPIRPPRQPNEVPGQEPDRTGRADQRSAAVQDDHQHVEVRPTMHFDLPAGSQPDDVGIELPVWHVQLPEGPGTAAVGVASADRLRIAEHAWSVGGGPADPNPPRPRALLEVLPRESPGLIALELVPQMFRLMIGYDREGRAEVELREPFEDQWVALRLGDLSHIEIVIAHRLSL